jgi:hypothetical protein
MNKDNNSCVGYLISNYKVDFIVGGRQSPIGEYFKSTSLEENPVGYILKS